MIEFLLPRLHPNLYKSINCESLELNIGSDIDDRHYLINIKKSIVIVQNEWEIYKNITNTLGFLYTLVPIKGHCVAMEGMYNDKSYFLLVEIIQKYYSQDFFYSIDFDTFHFSRHYNGIINAFRKFRGKNIKDVHTTVNGSYENSFNESIPDILNIQSFINVIQKYKSSIHFITVDIDNDDTEITYEYMMARTYYALCLQKHNGNCIFKFTNKLNKKYADIIALLCSLYKEVFLTKPSSCKSYTSEMYVVCNKYILSNCDKIYPYLLKQFSNKSASYLFKDENSINSFFYNKVIEYNTVLIQHQIENIHNTLSIILSDKNRNLNIHTTTPEIHRSNRESESKDCNYCAKRSEVKVDFIKEDIEKSKVQHLLNINIKKCIQFCKKHGIEISNIYKDA
jgi:hypothetical protein